MCYNSSQTFLGLFSFTNSSAHWFGASRRTRYRWAKLSLVMKDTESLYLLLKLYSWWNITRRKNTKVGGGYDKVVIEQWLFGTALFGNPKTTRRILRGDSMMEKQKKVFCLFLDICQEWMTFMARMTRCARPCNVNLKVLISNPLNGKSRRGWKNLASE